jgi:hypothetical protein
MAFLDVVIAVGVVLVVMGAILRKPRRHILSAEFKSTDISRIIRKG